MNGDHVEIALGDYVILYNRKKGRKWLVKVDKKVFSTDLGNINLEDLVGKRYGDIIYTSKKFEVKVLKPVSSDYIMYGERPTQIIYPKDIGYIILKLGIRHDSKILEVGTGSGGLTTGFAWILSDKGEITTYEKRKEFLEVARRNVSRIRPECKIRYVNMDFKEADIPSEYFDAAFIDIDSPWLVLDKVHKALKPYGRAGFLLPTYNQVDKLASKINKYFIDVEAVEIFLRNIRMKKGMVRPEFHMVGYTAVVVFGIKS